MMRPHALLQRIEKLNEIGIALSAEKDTRRLLEMILAGAKTITGADAGTLYSVREDGTACMEILRNDSLDLAWGGHGEQPIPFAPIPLYDGEGHPNDHTVVTYVVLHDTTVNIPDAYAAEGFDLSGTRAFDAETGYRSTSFLAVPMKNHEGDIIGVLQLLNATNGHAGEVVPFTEEAQRLAESLASQAAIALTNKRLIDNLEELFESLIRLIADAIDEKSPYTGGHCRRVPVLTMMLAEAAHRTVEGPLRDFTLSDRDRRELEIAAWLHDCGKITTPEYVVDKATKLETLFDRIHLVDARLEILRRDAEIALLKARLAAQDTDGPASIETAEQACRQTLEQLAEEQAFLWHCNRGGEFMSAADQDRVRAIGRRTWRARDGEEKTLLTGDEIDNLTIPKGTLTPGERRIINNHITTTLKMLESLPFPKHLRNVPEYAGGHHERMDGNGYPRGLARSQMSVQARIMGIADIFEALTAKDRPYKTGKTLSESLAILARMKQDHHIDPDLFDVFVREKVYLCYAEGHLDPRQIDQVDAESLLRPDFAPRDDQ